jgi:hypothetical protein
VSRLRQRIASAAKNLLVLALSSALFLALLEVGSGFVYSRVKKRPFSREAIRGRLLEERVQGTAADDLPASMAGEVEEMKDANVPDAPVILHPYFGFVVNPDLPGVNEDGFFQASPLSEANPDTIVVVFFGGSLSDQVFYMAGKTLREELSNLAAFRGKKIEIVSTAIGGYKQPQQLIVLSYMLARGAQWDIVVNIDGFNEIDSSTDNLNDGVNPFFPHNWKLHARQGLDAQAMSRLGKIEIIRERRRSLRDFFARAPLIHSSFFLTLWDLLDQGQEAELRRESHALEEILSGGLPARVRGPKADYPDTRVLYEEMALVWKRSSRLMAALCRTYGVEYFHFLQPNQYVPDSKPFTEEEREVAYRPEWAGSDRVPAAYPFLRERGRELRELGVNFTDLTGMFADEKRTVYNDFCCHVNELGATLIAEEIAAAIAGGMGEPSAGH